MVLGIGHKDLKWRREDKKELGGVSLSSLHSCLLVKKASLYNNYFIIIYYSLEI